MSLKIGIVGLPNVGKSTLFNALVKNAQAEAHRAPRSDATDSTNAITNDRKNRLGNEANVVAKVGNFPFTTIEPNVGIVPVADERLAKLAEIEKSAKVVPATIEFVDIAGLIRGAHKGEGLGNQFLSHIREVDAIVLVLRFFKESDTIHVEGSVDPKRDLETILSELALADLQVLAKRKIGLESDAKKPGKDGELAKKLVGIIDRIEPVLNKGQADAFSILGKDDRELAEKHLPLYAAKPMLLVLNVDEKEAARSAEELAQEAKLNSILPHAEKVAISAKVEAELAALDETEQKEYLETLGLASSGLDRLTQAAYKLLGLLSFFTAGPMEARAWTVCKGDTSFDAAGKIHTDFQKKFIRAEVIGYNDFVSSGGWKGAPEKGLMHLEGKDYPVKDGDVFFFRHG